MVDQQARLRALRALAAPGSGATEPERALAKEKADELERKLNSRSTNNTTTIGRDGIPPFGTPAWQYYADVENTRRRETASKIAEDLLKNQWRWNSEYYDMFGRARTHADPADLVEEEYQTDYKSDDEDEDEDYGYDLFENEGDEY